MQGKIIKGIAGFYYVHVVHSGIYECKAKGIFRNKKIKPLVGDNVEIDIIDEEKRIGNIVEIAERTNELIRPAVANIDQSLVVFAVMRPDPNINLLDRFLVMMERQDVPVIICFNKVDLVPEEELIELRDTYVNAGYHVIFTSTLNGNGVEDVKRILIGKTTAFAGPSGVGKSSMLNAIIPDANSETGGISEKIGRGKNTTRHTEIFNLEDETYIMDTPGFTSLYTNDFEKEELKWYFPEFREYEGKCRFNGCIHENEPDCAVKDALEEGKISESRYKNYLQMLDEIKNRKKY
ncbi:ribosome small subunit-dependent GTPase A [Lachnospiraceae bacterium HCP1S3_C3]|nr:ribosome small subunit-dependent GTPase A [Lachnospiraceae bacterium]